MSKKDVIYIDIEDDITSIIDKVKESKGTIVALVPPKRSTVLQSAVNMKLLKKVGNNDSKKIVLISTESTLKPLAGGVGLFMADSLTSRPYIPEVEDAKLDTSVIVDDEDVVDEDTGKKGKKAAIVGAGAGIAAAGLKSPEDADVGSTIDLSESASPSVDSKKEKLKPLKTKSKIPNFQRFRWRMIIGVVAAVLLIVGWFWAFKIAPSAVVAVKAQTSKVPTDTNFTAIADSDTNIDEAILKADRQELVKTVSLDFNATGEKDVGQKSTGTMTVQNCDSSTSLTVKSGTKFTDPNTGIVFISNSNVNVPGGVFSGGGCSSPGEAEVNVTAAVSGDDKNLSPRDYTVGGFGSTVSAYGDQMSGGTTKIVKVVSQKDVDDAKKQLAERNHSEEQDELNSRYGDSKIVIQETFEANSKEATATPSVGSEANKGTVSAQYTFSILGVEKSDLDKLLEKVQKEQLGNSDKAILKTGSEDGKYQIISKTDSSNMLINIKTTGYAGPEIDTEKIKEEIKGKRYSEALSIIKSKEGVNNAEIYLSPFWVSHIPTNLSKVTVNLEVSDQTAQ